MSKINVNLKREGGGGGKTSARSSPSFKVPEMTERLYRHSPLRENALPKTATSRLLSVGVVVVGAVARAHDGDAHVPILYLKYPVMQEGGGVGQIHTCVTAGARTWDGSPVRSSGSTRRTSTNRLSTMTHPMLAGDVMVRCCASLSFLVPYFFVCCTHCSNWRPEGTPRMV